MLFIGVNHFYYDNLELYNKRGIQWGVKEEEKASKETKVHKEKQEQNIPFSQKVVITIENISVYLYVLVCDFCVFLCGMVKCLGITPNVIEGIFGVMLVMVEGILFFILFDKVWPSHESKKIEKEAKIFIRFKFIKWIR